ncbi:MAG: Asp-tRNA(Asn)/Glu-tRNA(Gln) amidotransferase subunit GatA [Chloroflexi bacterium]|nr:Asp-tRNA(Asn)/Glu-tRNA(Gln) amidotransferase subunit GatA [Chloroflexota bacterium]
MSSTDLVCLTVAQAARLVKGKKLSPVELTQAVLERAQALNPKVNAYITITGEGAMAQARAAEREIAQGTYRGPLHGVPLAFKDLFDTAGVRTTGGSKILAQRVPDADSTAVAKLKAAGSVLLGKLNMHEFAFGISSTNPHYGPVRNPWDLKRIPGGSSGGSGAATVAHMCVASLGSDTGGSIRIPAALCGMVGLKPTYGRVSRFGALPLSWSLDHVGPMTKTVEDAAILLRAIAGHDPADPGSLQAPVPDYTRGLKAGVKGVRVGVLSNPYFDFMAPAVRQAFEAAVGTLGELGANVQPVPWPEGELAGLANMTIILGEAAAYHAGWLRTRPQDYGADVRDRLIQGSVLPASLYLQAQRARRTIMESALALFGGVELLVLPTIPVAAPNIGESTVELGGRRVDARAAITRYTQPFNLTGLPALSLPCGFSPEGLPIGLQVVGRPLGEAAVLRLGHAYEQATPWHKRQPPL